MDAVLNSVSNFLITLNAPLSGAPRWVMTLIDALAVLMVICESLWVLQGSSRRTVKGLVSRLAFGLVSASMFGILVGIVVGDHFAAAPITTLLLVALALGLGIVIVERSNGA